MSGRYCKCGAPADYTGAESYSYTLYLPVNNGMPIVVYAICGHGKIVVNRSMELDKQAYYLERSNVATFS
jgi:hypothetical protein